MTPDKRLVSPADAIPLIGGLSLSTINRLIKSREEDAAAGKPPFPLPVVLNRDRHGKPVRKAFVESELAAWNVAKIAADRNGR